MIIGNIDSSPINEIDEKKKFVRLPFEFGNRFLLDDDDVFSHNAWDNFEWDDDDFKRINEIITKQHDHPVDEKKKSTFNSKPEKYWDIFYKNNKQNFFKDRSWLKIEFPILFEMTKETDKKNVIMEVGCGAGNIFFPLLSQNKNINLNLIACDFLTKAIELIKSNELYKINNKKNIAFASIWDLSNTNNTLPNDVLPNSVDVLILVFVFLALSPDQWYIALNNMKKILKKDGLILFRDYGRYDLTQLRFKKERLLDENFYIRGDGTRVYFFTENELKNIFCLDGFFKEVKIGVCKKLIVNRKKKLKMHRIWLQAIFKNSM